MEQPTRHRGICGDERAKQITSPSSEASSSLPTTAGTYTEAYQDDIQSYVGYE
jgi:hypothetical protein